MLGLQMKLTYPTLNLIKTQNKTKYFSNSALEVSNIASKVFCLPTIDIISWVTNQIGLFIHPSCQVLKNIIIEQVKMRIQKCIKSLFKDFRYLVKGVLLVAKTEH
jgi:hypothetical protein